MNIRNLKDQPLDEIQVKKAGRQIKGFLIWLLKVVIIVGISYIILGPLITIVANSFFTANDLYNPVVMLLPAEGTLQNYITSFTRMTYPRTLATTFAYVISLTLIQIFICSMAGYGFARYEFPFKKVLFGCVMPGGCSAHGSAGRHLRRWSGRPARSRRCWTGCTSARSG